jgi:hypothetical protein
MFSYLLLVSQRLEYIYIYDDDDDDDMIIYNAAVEYILLLFAYK